MNVYINDDGTEFIIVPLVNDVEDWSGMYTVTDRADIPPDANLCFNE